MTLTPHRRRPAVGPLVGAVAVLLALWLPQAAAAACGDHVRVAAEQAACDGSPGCAGERTPPAPTCREAPPETPAAPPVASPPAPPLEGILTAPDALPKTAATSFAAGNDPPPETRPTAPPSPPPR